MASKKKYKKYSEIDLNKPGRKDFLALFNAYKENQIDFDTFDKDFSVLCPDNYQDFFSKSEYKAVSNLDDTLSWYTPSEEEQKMFNFKSMDQVEEAFQAVLKALNM